MNANTLKKVHQFGKVGKIVLTVLLVLSIVATAFAALATVVMAVLPQDEIVITMTRQTSYQGSSEAMKSMCQTGQATGEVWRNGRVTPFGSSYDTASMHEEGGVTVVETTSAPTSFNCGDAARLLLLTALFSAALAAALWLLRRMFKVIAGCETVFCDELVKKMKAFGWSLLPVALFDSVSATLARSFMTAGTSGVYIVWGWLIAFAVTMCLTVVFHYGVQLQRESDETL